MKSYKLNHTLLEGINSFEEYVNKYWRNSKGDLLFNDATFRLASFKEQIAVDLPEFTNEELIKYNAYKSKIDKLYKWVGHYELFIGLEIEEVLKSKIEDNIDKNNTVKYKPLEKWYKYYIPYKSMINGQVGNGFCVFEIKRRINSKEVIFEIIKDIEKEGVDKVSIFNFILLEIIPKGWAAKLLTKIGIWRRF